MTSMPSFEEIVSRALDSLPAEIAGYMENVAVVVEDENPEDPDIFGLFSEDPYMPAQITIYRLPLEETFSDPVALEDEIRITVLHEIGHYFGMDERQIAELGYE
jgi:predicted Zn-dependent protease with MMP-like domain